MRRVRSRVLTVHGTRYTIMERKGANGFVRLSPTPLFIDSSDVPCSSISSSVRKVTPMHLRFVHSRAGAPRQTHNLNNWRSSRMLVQHRVY